MYVCPAVQRLIKGNRRFVAGEPRHDHSDVGRVRSTSGAQAPFATVLACADSRVPVEVLFDQGIGDLFVCRNAGNVATVETIASIEYSVAHLGVKLILVMGHTSCGGVKAGLQRDALPGMLPVLQTAMSAAVQRAGGYDVATESDVVRANVFEQCVNVLRSDIVRKSGVAVVGAVYDLADAHVEFLTPRATTQK